MGVKHSKIFLFAAAFILFYSVNILFAQPANEAPVSQGDIYKKVILYIIMDSKDLYQIGVMDENGKNKKILTNEGNNWCPVVSPSGERIIYYSDRAGFANLWTMDADGSNQRTITNDKEDVIKIDLFNRGQSAWEKEGEEIFFLKKGDIWKIDKNGETPSAITRFHDVTSFKISPDGQWFLYSREKTKNRNGLWTMRTKGTDAMRITDSVIMKPAFDWGDSNNLAYFENRGIISENKTGYEKLFLKQTFYLDNDIEWCKTNNDRKQNPIAYISDAQNGPNIWIMNADGTNEKQMTEKGGFSPLWSVDGKSLLYIEGSDMYRIDVHSKEKTRLTYFFRSFYPVLADIRTGKAETEIKAKTRGGEENADKK
jgi:hypothetical protein